jgi:hypothetical protein
MAAPGARVKQRYRQSPLSFGLEKLADLPDLEAQDAGLADESALPETRRRALDPRSRIRVLVGGPARMLVNPAKSKSNGDPNVGGDADSGRRHPLFARS